MKGQHKYAPLNYWRTQNKGKLKTPVGIKVFPRVGDAENIVEELNESIGCGKEMFHKFTSIFGTTEWLESKCGDFYNNKKVYCDKCKK